MMINRFNTLLLIILASFFLLGEIFAQDPVQILQKAMEKLNGEHNQATITMSIIRPTYTRDIEMKTWANGIDFSLVLITAPARDKGIAFLKREKEIWNWQPKIDRSIKLPPSMMMQNWMGSDFTNDDLVRQSSMVDDYSQKLLGEEEIDGRMAYKIELIPNDDAPVVWGKVLIWIDKVEYLQLKTEFYDEDGYVVSTMLGKEIKEIGGKMLPTKLELIPADEPENKTIITYQNLTFNEAFPESFFTIQNMKRVR